MSDERAAVIAANAAFYDAFAAGALDAMGDVWARGAPVTCIHPGWGVLAGRDEVMASWAAILTAPERPAIACIDPQAMVLGDVALVVCFERVGGGFLAATNGFVREDGAWRMVHHQAGATRDGPQAKAETRPGHLH
ncbi:MAG: nuclear transport factor 2 family protein [Alphaproteobacteria bacterium]|nr:nuclear transport factor 2 family protein [Alphaproteobacteria bacterium]